MGSHTQKFRCVFLLFTKTRWLIGLIDIYLAVNFSCEIVTPIQTMQDHNRSLGITCHVSSSKAIFTKTSVLSESFHDFSIQICASAFIRFQ